MVSMMSVVQTVYVEPLKLQSIVIFWKSFDQFNLRTFKYKYLNIRGVA